MSTAKKDPRYILESPAKVLQTIMEQEIPLDFSKMSNLCSFEANVTQDYTEDRINSIKKEIQKYDRKGSLITSDKESSGTKVLDSLDRGEANKLSSIKKPKDACEVSENGSNKNLNKLEYSDSSDHEDEFYKNNFNEEDEDPRDMSHIDVQDPMLVLFGNDRDQNNSIQIPQIQKSQSVQNPQRSNQSSDRKNSLNRACRILANKTKYKLSNSFQKWYVELVASKFTNKIQSAASMVDKMSRFSRNFIAINTLSGLLAKRKQKVITTKFSHWK